jgi:energy-coupling factor transporter ATP-binding protein EcfA2
MINRLYVDNYRCFTNFEWKPEALTLLLGDNGSGKTSLFDIVETLRDFVGTPCTTQDAFPATSLTAWDTRREQTFELGFLGNGGQYVYRLVVEQAAQLPRNRIKFERLSYDDITLYQFEDNEAHLFRDDGSPGPVFPVDWSRSAIGTIPSRHDNTRLTWFRNALSNVHIISPVPSEMSSDSTGELAFPDRRLRGYVSWLRFLANDLAFAPRLVEALRPVLCGFDGMRFATTGETAKELRFSFDFEQNGPGRPKKSFYVPFDQLSDGQRCITALYTSLVLAKNQEVTLLWDEPDNFVSLREIQPWLSAIQDLVDEQAFQCILASHHPELINALAADHGATLYREPGGPARIKPFEWNADGISPAEIVARGWEA